MWTPKEDYKEQITATFSNEQWTVLEEYVPEFIAKYYKREE